MVVILLLLLVTVFQVGFGLESTLFQYPFIGGPTKSEAQASYCLAF
jgi:hypothetical protein